VNARFVPKTRDEQRALSRAMICASAKQLLQAKGFDAVSVEEIAKAARVTRSTFYLHFRSKEEVLREIVLDMLQDVLGVYEDLVARPVLDYPTIRAWLETFHRNTRAQSKDTLLLRDVARLNPDERQALILGQRMRTIAILGRRFEGMRLTGDSGAAEARKRALAHLLVIQMEGVIAYFSATEGAPDADQGLDILAEQLAAMGPA
jgi:AcrR family transcriptional regulator